jgi:hypothetical protein
VLTDDVDPAGRHRDRVGRDPEGVDIKRGGAVLQGLWGSGDGSSRTPRG